MTATATQAGPQFVEVDLYDSAEGTYPYQDAQDGSVEGREGVTLNHLPRQGEWVWDELNKTLWVVTQVLHPLLGGRTRVYIELVDEPPFGELTRRESSGKEIKPLAEGR